MTKNAQQALKYLLQTCGQNVRFCLICNYISKIDESLKTEFISIRFNQLPIEYIHSFLKKVSDSESLNLSEITISKIQQLYHSDIRSMINFIQLHQHIDNWNNIIITDNIYEKIQVMLEVEQERDNQENRDFTFTISQIVEYIFEISKQFNTDKISVIIGYIQYIIKNYPGYISSKFLDTVECIIHIKDTNIKYLLYYFCQSIRDLIKENKSG
jgi:DNA polymerase III delta prime subunit